VGPLPFSLFDSLLVVGIPAANRPAMDISPLPVYSLYAVLLFLLCVLFFPEEMADYDGFKAYFYSRRKWIFSLMIVLFIADIADTWIKGSAYLHTLGPIYYIRVALYILLSAAAIKISNERFHAGFAIFATTYELLLILKYYMTMG
jgi:hypothetical protein